MSDTIRHLVEDGDPKVDEAWCHCGKFRFSHPSKSKRLAEAYRHLANLLDPPEETS